MDSIFRTRGTGISSRRRVDDRAAAPVRARRRRDPEERDRDRRLEPRGPDRPGDPAAGAARREDQDRAPRRRAGRRTSWPSTCTRPCRSTPTRSRRASGDVSRPRPPHDRDRRSTGCTRRPRTNRFLEVTYASGDKEILYFKDFNSGAMIENIVRRAKKEAIKRFLSMGEKGIKAEDLLARDPRRVQGERGPARTRPTPTTGRGSRARRASASSTCARCSATATARAGRSSASAPASTCKVAGWPSPRSSAPRPSTGSPRSGARLQPGPLVLAADQHLRGRAPPDPLGLRAGVTAPRRPRVRAGPAARTLRGGPRSRERDPAERRPLLRRPRAPRVLHARVRDAARPRDPRQGGGADARAVARGGRSARCPARSALAIYKNNSDGKGNSYGTHENYLVDRRDAVRQHRARPDAVLRDAVRSSRGAGKLGARGPVGRAGRATLPAHAARGLLRDRGRPGDDPEAPDHQHARRAARRPREVPAAARDRRRREPVRGRDLPEARHHGDRAQDDRGRRTCPTSRWRTRCRRSTTCRATSTCTRADPPGRRPQAHGGADPVGVPRAGAEVRRAARTTRRTTARCSSAGRPCSRRSRTTPMPLHARARLGGQVPAARGLPRAGRARLVRPQAAADRPAVPRRPPRQGPVLPAGRHGQGRAARLRRGGRAARSWSRPRTRAPTSAAGASRGTPTRSPRPRGTR